MKKKGLIISTVVMAVVMIASLTTATYAWFSLSSSATINDIAIETKASDGLQIAAYHDASGATTYSYGTLSNKAGGYWFGDSANGFGDNLTLQATNGKQIAAMYGVSGNGINLYKNADTVQTLELSKLPQYVSAATANTNYFELDFALQNVSDRTANIYIDKIEVTPTGSNSAQYNMAGSLRMAVFATTSKTVGTDFTPNIEDNGIFLYDPYGAIGYDGTANFTTGSKDDTTCKYVAVGTKVGTGNGSALSGSSLVVADGEDYYAYAATTALQTTWTTAKYLTGTLTSATHYSSSGILNSKLTSNYTNNGATVVSADATPASYVYIKLIIWYEAEDNCSRQAFAGGGAQIGISFALETAAEKADR